MKREEYREGRWQSRGRGRAYLRASMEPNTDSGYHPEPYWSKVAQRVASRAGVNVIAGDDEPYYVYKREQTLKSLLELDFDDRRVLEVGSGPGGNLLELSSYVTERLAGADISADMIAVARARLPEHVELHKTDGTRLPFDDRAFDLVFSVTVVQHNTDDRMMRRLVGDMARVCAEELVLIENVDTRISGDELMRRRPPEYYAGILGEHGFELVATDMIDTVASYYVCGALRKGLNPGTREEGQPLTPLSLGLQRALLPVTKALDKVLTHRRDLARMRFRRVVD